GEVRRIGRRAHQRSSLRGLLHMCHTRSIGARNSAVIVIVRCSRFMRTSVTGIACSFVYVGSAWSSQYAWHQVSASSLGVSVLAFALLWQEALEVRGQVCPRRDCCFGLVVVLTFQHRHVRAGLLVLGNGLVVQHPPSPCLLGQTSRVDRNAENVMKVLQQ